MCSKEERGQNVITPGFESMPSRYWIHRFCSEVESFECGFDTSMSSLGAHVKHFTSANVFTFVLFSCC